MFVRTSEGRTGWVVSREPNASGEVLVAMSDKTPNPMLSKADDPANELHAQADLTIVRNRSRVTEAA